MGHTSKNRVLKNNTFKQRISGGNPFDRIAASVTGATMYCNDLKKLRKKLFEFVDTEKQDLFISEYTCYSRNQTTGTAAIRDSVWRYNPTFARAARCLLFSDNPDPQWPGMTLAHIAAIRGNLPFLQFLEKEYQKINETDKLPKRDEIKPGSDGLLSGNVLKDKYPTFGDFLKKKCTLKYVGNSYELTAFELLYLGNYFYDSMYIIKSFKESIVSTRNGRNLHIIEEWFLTQELEKPKFEGDKLNLMQKHSVSLTNLDRTQPEKEAKGEYSFLDTGVVVQDKLSAAADAASKPIAGSAAAASAASSTAASGTGCSIDAMKQGELRKQYSNIPPNAVFICLQDGTPYIIVHGTNTYSLNFTPGPASSAHGSAPTTPTTPTTPASGAPTSPEQTILDNLNGLITGSSISNNSEHADDDNDEHEEL